MNRGCIQYIKAKCVHHNTISVMMYIHCTSIALSGIVPYNVLAMEYHSMSHNTHKTQWSTHYNDQKTHTGRRVGWALWGGACSSCTSPAVGGVRDMQLCYNGKQDYRVLASVDYDLCFRQCPLQVYVAFITTWNSPSSERPRQLGTHIFLLL